jgi:hypothetical protein
MRYFFLFFFEEKKIADTHMTDNGNTTIYPYQIKGLCLQSQTGNHSDKKRPVSMEEDVYHNENLAFLFIYLFLRKMKEFKNQKYIYVFIYFCRK